VKRKEIVLFIFHISTYFSFADEFNHGSVIWVLRGWSRDNSAAGTKNLVDKKVKKERRKDARSHLECMQLALFRAMFMRGEVTGLSLLEIMPPVGM